MIPIQVVIIVTTILMFTIFNCVKNNMTQITTYDNIIMLHNRLYIYIYKLHLIKKSFYIISKFI